MGDLRAFRAELQALGFECGAGWDSPEVERAFALLGQPRSFEASDVAPGAYAYLEKLPRGFDGAGFSLLFLDKKSDIAPGALKVPALVVSHAAAAVDHLVRARAPRDWAGTGHTAPANVTVETNVLIGPYAQIGAGTVLETGVRIGAGVKIGRDCRIGAFSRIGDHCELGDGCELSSHVAIGGQGFGFVSYPRDQRPRPRRHIGRVVIGNRVRIGSFVAIDRGVFEDTRVGDGTAIDNLVQIAHNCTLGSDDVICGFVGLSGSTTVGDRVTIAGMVGTKGHVAIGNDATVAAQSGVSRDVPAGTVVKGYPPRPLKEALALQTLVGRLPDFFSRLRALESKKDES